MARVGVVADSHVGEFIDELPESVGSALAGCDLIVHAGDICHPRVLDELAAIAPVVAVRGDHDGPELASLPVAAAVTVAGVRIGVTHGRRWYPIDVAVTLVRVLSGGRLNWDAGRDRALLRRTGPVDVLVYGHWHVPDLRVVDGTMIFSPGAVCPWGSLAGGRPPRPGLKGLADRIVRRDRRLRGAEAMRPAVGIIHIEGGAARAQRIPLADA